jgi:hypothetical protein
MLTKGKSGLSRPQRGLSDRSEAESVALGALNRLIAQPERLAGFLSVTGLRPDTIRAAARSPGFLAGVLDFVSQDENLLVSVASELDLDPARIAEARQRLSPEANPDP